MRTQFAKKVASCAVAVALLSACQSTGHGGYGQGGGYGTKQTVGTLGGAVAGAALGSQVGGGTGRVAAIAAGTLLGAMVGGGIGASLDRMDQMYYNQTSSRALESYRTGQTASWSNPDSGNYGTITPTRTYQTAAGENCREYNQTITVGGRTERGYGTACRQPDGSWQIVQ